MAVGFKRGYFFQLGFALILIIVGGITYGFSLGLPFFSDDMLHFRWLQWSDWTRILSSSRGIGYYRPLPFIIWKCLWSLQGRLHAPTLHAINFGLHWLNPFLVWGCVKGQRWRQGTVLGALAALVFLLYPFSYQAVPWVGSLTHPLLGTLILGSIRLYQMGELHSSRWLRAGSVALAFLALFAHDTGILLAPLLSLVLFTGEKRISLWESIKQTRLYWFCTFLGFVLWLIIPKDVRPALVWNLEARYQNGVYLLQGLAFPVAPLARRILAAGWGLDDLQSTLLVSLPTVFIWGLLLWKAGGNRPLILAGGWFALAAAPAWLMLGFEYVIDGPRLLYLASVGIALFWAIPVALPWQSRKLKTAGRAIALFALLVVAWSGYRFIRERAAMYHQLRQIVTQFIHAVRTFPSSGTILCVNCPLFLAPRNPTFAVGHEGVPLMGPHQLDDLFWVNTGEERAITGVVLPDLQHPWKYHYGGAGDVHTMESIQALPRKAVGVILTDYNQEDIAVYPAGALEATGVPLQREFLADFSGQVRLLSAMAEQEGDTLRITLWWQSVQPIPEDTTVFLHIFAPSGELVGQRDGYPLMGLSRPIAWQPGDIWQDVRVVRLPAGFPVDSCLPKVGLYRTSNSNVRLEAVDPAGQRFPENAVPIGR